MRTLPVMTLLTLAAVPLVSIPLAACSSSGSGGDAAVSRSQLVVHVTLSGGPITRDGRMALSNSPDVDDQVTVTGSSRHTWSARIEANGDAIFRLPAGRYRVSAGNCPAHHAVELRGGAAARVSLHCDVP